jgi:hypothetical protein
MPVVGNDSLRGWVEVELTLFTLAVFLFVGVLVFRSLQQRKRRLSGLRVYGKSRIASLVFRFRALRIRHFQQISAQVMSDSFELLANSATLCLVDNYEARTMLPLVSEARKLGERLLAQRRRRHLLFGRSLERQIELTIYELLELETKLRSIPRAFVTLEDVVAGRFQ